MRDLNLLRTHSVQVRLGIRITEKEDRRFRKKYIYSSYWPEQEPYVVSKLKLFAYYLSQTVELLCLDLFREMNVSFLQFGIKVCLPYHIGEKS